MAVELEVKKVKKVLMEISEKEEGIVGRGNQMLRASLLYYLIPKSSDVYLKSSRLGK